MARLAAAQGAELRLLTRATSKLEAIEGLAAEVVVGDLRERTVEEVPPFCRARSPASCAAAARRALHRW